MHDAFFREAADITETLRNLAYLICAEADHPAKVRYYGTMSEARLAELTELLKTKLE
jgi:hypothetical protein